MKLTEKLVTELQRRLKVGNRRSFHLNGIPANARYKFDLIRLSNMGNVHTSDFEYKSTLIIIKK